MLYNGTELGKYPQITQQYKAPLYHTVQHMIPIKNTPDDDVKTSKRVG
jgi:hypothetical protein